MPLTPAHIRSARPEDREALYRICLETGDAGEDATALYQAPELLGHIYAGPYLAFSPELALVLQDELGVCGYILGVRDTSAFEATLEREWWPALRARYPLSVTPPQGETPDDQLIRLIHAPPRQHAAWLEAYPAHLHIDLLPRAQGSGGGRRLMQALFSSLRAFGVPGVHLGVSRRNERATGFYRHLGFQTLGEDQWSLQLGHDLRAAPTSSAKDSETP